MPVGASPLVQIAPLFSPWSTRPGEDTAEFEAIEHKALQDESLLRDALGAAGLESWAQRVGAEDYHDFPLELAGKCGVIRERDRKSLLDIQLTDRYVPPRTVAQPQPVQPHTSFRPKTWRDLLTTEALAKLDALVSKTVASLPPGKTPARRPPALALGQEDLVP